MIAIPPAGIGVSLALSNVLPKPRLSVPDSTVTCSALECQCAGIMHPSGSLARNVNGLSLSNGPCKTAVFVPHGSAFASVHSSVFGSSSVCPAAPCSPARTGALKPLAKPTSALMSIWRFMGPLLVCAPRRSPSRSPECDPSLPRKQASAAALRAAPGRTNAERPIQRRCGDAAVAAGPANRQRGRTQIERR
jgi:hypothetical protein